MIQKLIFILSTLISFCTAAPTVTVGADRLFSDEFIYLLKNKNIGIITNHTAVDRNMQATLDLLFKHSLKNNYRVKAIFAPEHGLYGSAYASEEIKYDEHTNGVPIFFLHGKTAKPTAEMLKNLDLIIYDIQDIGARSYTYCTTLFYAMEEAAKNKIDVMVLDRPNPINGTTIDGPLLDKECRSTVGYINVPYCHGMTIGELARFFNSEYNIGCKLKVIPMRGWNREMTFQDTKLPWIPTSPQIPESMTPFFYPTTGILGELSIVNIGIGYTLPFKVVGAPWIDAENFAKMLNKQHFPGVHFEPFHYKPFYGKFAHKECHGVLIVVTNTANFKPVTTQYLILGILKSLYPKRFSESLESAKSREEMFHKVNGTKQIYNMIKNDDYIVWKLRTFQEKERELFRKKRQKYLISEYSQ